MVNAFALAMLVVALPERLTPATPGWAAVLRARGLIWTALVLSAGMIAHAAVERAGAVHAFLRQAVADLWGVLNVVELGLGGGNEIVAGSGFSASASPG